MIGLILQTSHVSKGLPFKIKNAWILSIEINVPKLVNSIGYSKACYVFIIRTGRRIGGEGKIIIFGVSCFLGCSDDRFPVRALNT
jgi:hypothetical protein